MLKYFSLVFAFSPSLIWLLFYLKKDIHPEPKKMILKIFFLGMLLVIPVAFLEKGIAELLNKLNFFPIFLSSLIYAFLVVALIEESAKYLVIKIKVIKNKEFNEPVDAMIYMITAGLGFAALENFFVFWPLIKTSQAIELLMLGSFRFIGAVFLHALCSGVIGYFLGLSFFQTTQTKKNKNQLLVIGFLIAVFLHGSYNFFIILNKKNLEIIMPLIILFGLALFVSWGFRKLKLINSN